MKALALLVAVVSAAVIAAAPGRAVAGDHQSGPIKMNVVAWSESTTDASLAWRPFNNAVHYQLSITRVGGGAAVLGLGDDATGWSGNLASEIDGSGPGDTFLVQVVGCRDDRHLADAWQCWVSNTATLTAAG